MGPPESLWVLNPVAGFDKRSQRSAVERNPILSLYHSGDTGQVSSCETTFKTHLPRNIEMRNNHRSGKQDLTYYSSRVRDWPYRKEGQSLTNQQGYSDSKGHGKYPLAPMSGSRPPASFIPGCVNPWVLPVITAREHACTSPPLHLSSTEINT